MPHLPYFKEARLLSFHETPDVSEKKEGMKPLDSIKGSLRSLESSVYRNILESTKDRALVVEHGSRIECSDATGTRSYTFELGNLIQKEQDGYLMISGSSLLFVPNENFTGSVTAVKNGARQVLKQAVAPAEAPSAKQDSAPEQNVDQPAQATRAESAEQRPESIDILLSANDTGIRGADGTTLTFLPGETRIKNSLGTLTRKNTNELRATYTPAKGMSQDIFVGSRKIYPITVVREDAPQTAKTPTPKPPTEVPKERVVTPPAPRNAVERISEDMEATMQKLELALNDPDTTSSLRGSTRQFVKLYKDHWKSVDPQGAIGNRLFSSNAFRQLQVAIDARTYASEPAGLEKASREALIQFAEKLAGPENPSQERNKYIAAYNGTVRNRLLGSIRDRADAIYDRRNANDPRGRHNEKQGRIPLYRSAQTVKMLEFLQKKNDAFKRLATASDEEAPQIARLYRSYENAYYAIRYMLGQKYDKQWGNRERSITMGDGSVRDASLNEQVDAFWKKHLSIDALMVEDTPRDKLVRSNAERRRAEERLEKLAPEYPSRF